MSRRIKLLSRISLNPGHKKQLERSVLHLNRIKPKLSSDWICATKVKNYILKDPYVDFLKIKTNKFGNDNFEKTHSFPNFLSKQGIKFEQEIIDFIRILLPTDDVVTIASNFDARDPIFYEKTKKMIKEKKIPVLYQPVLHNHTNKTFGIPDLLIRNDYLSKLFPMQNFDNIPKHLHYVIIDIKFSTLNVKSDNIHLLNQNNISFYKSQLCIYNEALGNVQGYKPKQAYILGRRFKSKTSFVNNPFYKLGTISFNGSDKKIISETKKAIKWIKRLKKYGNNWNVLPIPSVKELYPNMKQKSIGLSVSQLKNKLIDAKNLNEITMLWNCGIKHRNIAHKNNIFKWNDKKCNSKMLGFNETKTAEIIDRMIVLNRDFPTQFILYNKEELNIPKKDPNTMEFFFDFETVNDVLLDVSVPSNAKFTGNVIFMTGIGHMLNKKWNFKPFYTNDLSKIDEKQSIIKFFDYLKTFGNKKIVLYHWGSIENTQLKRIVIDNNINTSGIDYKLIDLCKIIKDNKIVFKDSFGFGLKSISKSMFDNGYMTEKIYWNKNTSISDGMSAMVNLIKCYKKSKENQSFKNIESLPIIKDIEQYNNSDCSTMECILKFIRTL